MTDYFHSYSDNFDIRNQKTIVKLKNRSEKGARIIWWESNPHSNGFFSRAPSLAWSLTCFGKVVVTNPKLTDQRPGFCVCLVRGDWDHSVVQGLTFRWHDLACAAFECVAQSLKLKRWKILFCPHAFLSPVNNPCSDTDTVCLAHNEKTAGMMEMFSSGKSSSARHRIFCWQLCTALYSTLHKKNFRASALHCKFSTSHCAALQITPHFLKGQCFMPM